VLHNETRQLKTDMANLKAEAKVLSTSLHNRFLGADAIEAARNRLPVVKGALKNKGKQHSKLSGALHAFAKRQHSKLMRLAIQEAEYELDGLGEDEAAEAEQAIIRLQDGMA
jgi:hypothetical protein